MNLNTLLLIIVGLFGIFVLYGSQMILKSFFGGEVNPRMNLFLKLIGFVLILTAFLGYYYVQP
jgi:hypothetical protein